MQLTEILASITPKVHTPGPRSYPTRNDFTASFVTIRNEKMR
jgi:hypothetical protein